MRIYGRAVECAATMSGCNQQDRASFELVVHVCREEREGKEITRIISARRAQDIRRYQTQEVD